jgi:hypothetical protein
MKGVGSNNVTGALVETGPEREQETTDLRTLEHGKADDMTEIGQRPGEAYTKKPNESLKEDGVLFKESVDAELREVVDLGWDYLKREKVVKNLVECALKTGENLERVRRTCQSRFSTESIPGKDQVCVHRSRSVQDCREQHELPE